MPAASPNIADHARPVAERRGVDRAAFEREIAGSYEPVVLRGLVSDWPAVAASRDVAAMSRYLRDFASDKPVETFVGAPEINGRFFYGAGLRGLNFEKHPIPLTATIDKLLNLISQPRPPAIYAGAAAAPEFLPGFAEANVLPLLDAAIRPRVWIGNATTISTHYDLSANIACVVAGKRRFMLFPPEQTPNLYVGPLDFTLAGQPVSMVDPDAPDLDLYPRFVEAIAQAG
jgi:hypothetical protein